jgi:alkanesulfonate monooxygenase SsuD/methylene tetrahydromethanopterin reductase-like flavin-dependent oxidoreductase (luciferase family)
VARPLKVGVQLPEAEREVRWPELMAMARRIEALGFDSLWAGDHLLYRNVDGEPSGPWEVWSVLAALAVATEKIEFGPFVASTSFHNPGIIAKKAATIDEISGGRLILGLGAGWNVVEYEAFGFPYDHRVDRFEEAFTIIRTLLEGDEVTYHGRYYDVEKCLITPRGPRIGGPPLLVGSLGPRMLEITLPYVTYWNCWYVDFGNDPANLPSLMKRLDDACLNVGRNPATLNRTVALLIQTSRGAGRKSAYSEGKNIPPIIGSPEQLAEVLRVVAGHGIDHVQLVLDPITLDAIEEVAPVLEILDRG